jgi:Mrp family chromosome partitioning ATPase
MKLEVPMSSVQINGSAEYHPTLFGEEEPALSLVRVRDVERQRRVPEQEPESDLLRTGIQSLYGQLSACTARCGRPIRTLGVTSCYEKEGKTTIGSHLASVAAENSQVLYVDANAPRPLVHRQLQEMIRARTDREGSEGILHPSLLPLSEARASDSVVPPLGETRLLLEHLSKQFNLVVVEMPPIESAGALEWGTLVDGIIVVVESERVRWQVAARCISMLEQAGGHLLGAVINKRRNYIPDWLYRLI